MRAFAALSVCMVLGAAQASAQPAMADTLTNGTVAMCGDENEWPPYTYYERTRGERSDHVIGYTMSVLDAIFSRQQMRYSVTLLPWARCLAEVKNGARFQMALDMSTNAERSTTYLLTRTYYSIIPHYFYSRRAHPKGLHISSLAQLSEHALCGLQGHIYSAYGLAPNQVDQGARTYDAVLQKLRVGRCDLFLSGYEVMLGFGMTGKPVLDDPDLAHAPVPQLAPFLYFIGISRNYQHAAQLKALFDQALTQMEASGQLAAIWTSNVNGSVHGSVHE